MTMHRAADYTAGGAAVSSIAWGPALNAINQGLTALSLALGIAFLLWRWKRAVKKPNEPEV